MGQLHPQKNVGNLISLISGQFLRAFRCDQPTGWKGPKASTPFHVHETPSSPQSLPYKDASPLKGEAAGPGCLRPNRHVHEGLRTLVHLT